jgi:MFS family permease
VTPQREGLAKRTFASLSRHRNYRLFFLGQIVSVSGTWMQNVAMYWLVLQLTDSAVAVGVLSFARFAPAVFLAPFAGTVADGFDNRHGVMATQATQLVLAAALTTLAFSGRIEPWHLFAAAALSGTVHCYDTATRAGLTYEMVGRDELPNAVALNTTLFNAARVGGPAVAGVVISLFGVAWCFAINAASFLAVLASLLLMRAAELIPPEREERPRLLSGTREGLAFVRHQPRLAAVLSLVTVYATLLFNVEVLLPIVADQTLHRGPGTFALFMSMFGLGALVGSLAVASRDAASWRTGVGAAVVLALLEIAIGPLRAPAVVAGLLFLAGIAFAVFIVIANALVQLETPDRLRGRVLSLYFMSWSALAPAGSIFIAWICAVRGTGTAFVVIGLIGLAAVVVVQRRLHRATELAAGLV